MILTSSSSGGGDTVRHLFCGCLFSTLSSTPLAPSTGSFDSFWLLLLVFSGRFWILQDLGIHSNRLPVISALAPAVLCLSPISESSKDWSPQCAVPGRETRIFSRQMGLGSLTSRLFSTAVTTSSVRPGGLQAALTASDSPPNGSGLGYTGSLLRTLLL